mmetsp:Transcript_23962/g.70288  ORF Transcript_23962/g.70288 Transcript_23962/m.70288 type:complete len:966 (+) Transcript_23962:81-2978(+)
MDRKGTDTKRLELVTRMTTILRSTHVQTSLCWLYTSKPALVKVRSCLADIASWGLQIANDQPYRMKCATFSLIFMVLKRAEIGDLTMLGFDPMAVGEAPETFPGDTVDLYQAMELRELHCRAAAFAVHLLASGAFDELRLFCARVLAICSFRLPLTLGVALDETVSAAVVHRGGENGGGGAAGAADHGEVIGAEGAPPPSPAAGSAGAKEGPRDQGTAARPSGAAVAWLEESQDPSFSALAVDRRTVKVRDPVVKLLDWRPLHHLLVEHFGEAALQAQDAVVPALQPGVEALLRRQTGFYALYATQWMRYALDTLATSKAAAGVQVIKWHEVPGYLPTLRSFLLQIRRFPPGRYPRLLRRLSYTMVSNPAVVSILVRHILRKTNIHDQAAVSNTMDSVSSWLSGYRRWMLRMKHAYENFEVSEHDLVKGTVQGSPWDVEAPFFTPVLDPKFLASHSVLPPYFDFQLLAVALRMVLVDRLTLSSNTTIKALELLYRDWDGFPETKADNIRSLLLQAFPTLFLHWDPQVARFFHHVLAYRVLRQHGWACLANDRGPLNPSVMGDMMYQHGDDEQSLRHIRILPRNAPPGSGSSYSVPGGSSRGGGSRLQGAALSSPLISPPGSGGNGGSTIAAATTVAKGGGGGTSLAPGAGSGSRLRSSTFSWLKLPGFTGTRGKARSEVDLSASYHSPPSSSTKANIPRSLSGRIHKTSPSPSRFPSPLRPGDQLSPSEAPTPPSKTGATTDMSKSLRRTSSEPPLPGLHIDARPVTGTVDTSPSPPTSPAHPGSSPLRLLKRTGQPPPDPSLQAAFMAALREAKLACLEYRKRYPTTIRGVVMDEDGLLLEAGEASGTGADDEDVYSALEPMRTELEASRPGNATALPTAWKIPEEAWPYAARSVLAWSAVWTESEHAYSLAKDLDSGAEIHENAQGLLNFIPQLHWTTVLHDETGDLIGGNHADVAEDDETGR